MRQTALRSVAALRPATSRCLYAPRVLAPLRPVVPCPRSLTIAQQTRLNSTTATAPKQRSKLARAAIKTLAACGFVTLTLAGAIIAIFAYDATTYTDECKEQDLGIPALALNPRRGGPKNLPIAEALVGRVFQRAGTMLTATRLTTKTWKRCRSHGWWCWAAAGDRWRC